MDARAVKMFVTAIVSVLAMIAGARPTDAGCQVCHRKCCVYYGHGYKECFMAKDPVTGECLWCMTGGELCRPDPAMTEAEDEKPTCRASPPVAAVDVVAVPDDRERQGGARRGGAPAAPAGPKAEDGRGTAPR